MIKKTLPRLALLTVAAITLAGSLLKGKIVHEPFDPIKWKNWTGTAEQEWSLRWDMMNDLRKRHPLMGLKRSEVIAMLGAPGSALSPSEIVYPLGYSKHAINAGRLMIRFDGEDKVVQYWVWEG